MRTATIGLLILSSAFGNRQNPATTNLTKQQTQTTAQEVQTEGDAASARKSAVSIVIKIQRADYEGDRAALNKLYDELVPFADQPEFASRVRYWRGFAKWRRAINGFNETPTPTDLAQDLTDGESEFDAAIQRDPNFVDAKIGAASCILFRQFAAGTFSKIKDFEKMKEIMAPASQLLRDARAAAPENPRLLWVIGPNEWSTPPANIGQAKAMDTYERGLKAARAQKSDAGDPLEPSWGEPELLMSLAWSNLDRATPDLNAAENYAKAALQLVPYWHYVRDILMQQIRDAKSKAH
jgi:hypothetical protein